MKITSSDNIHYYHSAI